ncbi:MAG TPA: hypothetical protein ENI11_03915 [Actinobacteria bacterium]|nr:hypothetical protein [Actinomycetota bacterium]
MNGQTLKRFIVKGTMTYIAVFSLVLMVAMPALALMANSVGTREIKNHSIRSADIRNKAVTTDRIAPRAVKRGKIGKRAIRTEHIKYIGDSKIRYSRKTGYLSIPVSALVPLEDGYNYERGFNLHMIAGAGQFQAPVYLPQGAVVTKVRYNYKDDVIGKDTSIELSRVNNLNNSVDSMAGPPPASSDSPAWQVLTYSSINYATINNNSYAYYVFVWLSGADTDLRAGNIVINYTYTSPGS